MAKLSFGSPTRLFFNSQWSSRKGILANPFFTDRVNMKYASCVKAFRKHVCLLLPCFWKSSCVTPVFSTFDRPCYIVSVIQTASQDKVRIAVLLKWRELSHLPLYRGRSLAGRCSSSFPPSSARTWRQISQGCIAHIVNEGERVENVGVPRIFSGRGQTGYFVTNLPLRFCFMTISANLPKTLTREI
jgi:hypothetical protein